MRAYGPDPAIEPYSAASWEPTLAVRRRRRIPVIHIVLFVATFLTTSLNGAFEAGVDPLVDPASIRAGFPFSVALLSILLFHEFGHYILAAVHGVRATLPYFIPAPPMLIGTFGAFIRMKSLPPNRRALFDIGAAGPWAGLMVAIPAVLIGLRLSEVRPLGVSEGGLVLGDSILFRWLTRLALGTSPDDVTIMLHPIALAGWFGLFVTVLNLLPIGQLDGGHVAYALFGRGHRWISRLALVAIAILGFMGWPGWFVWVLLPVVIGVDHPPTRDAVTPLDGRRRLAAWLTVVIFVLIFIPQPLTMAPPAPAFEGERTPVVWQAHRPAAPPRIRFVVPFPVTPRVPLQRVPL
jgi:membrane-associated protease RseP (regulator of RpoE activity)